jgi:hypothetical protein
MAIAVSIVGVAFAAFCVWLTVRIANRRERWAKWSLAVVVGLPVLYVASFGPACWISSRSNMAASLVPTVYRPLVWELEHGALHVRTAIYRFTLTGAKDGWDWSFWDAGPLRWELCIELTDES